jgi:small-conductance mechanosensitive channel
MTARVSSTEQRVIVTAAIVVLVGVIWTTAGAVARRRADDEYSEFYVARVIRYAACIVAVVAIALLWQVFQGRGPLVIGFLIAGLTFSLQEVIGAIAGWFNILTGHIYRVGDRVEIAGVHGDVIDVSLLRTKLLEFGSDQPAETDVSTSWVHGRQYTGRVIVLSNKSTFTEPVFNYSGALGFVWEEVTIPVAYGSDWELAERILEEEAATISAGETAERAIRELEQRYPVPQTEVEPRVFVNATDNYIELAARFVVPVREARTRKSTLVKNMLQRFDSCGIQVASTTVDVTLHRPGGSESS